MSIQDKENELVTASFTIPADHKDRIEQIAKSQDLNASQVVRRILADHFAKLDAEKAEKESAPRKRQTIAA